MPEGIYITRCEFNQMMKDINYIKERLVNNSKPSILRKWISPEEAMEMIGCKVTKLKQLRAERLIEFKYSAIDKRGYGKGLQINKQSVEAYMEAMTHEGIYKAPLRKVS